MGRAGLFRTKPKLAAEVLIRVANLTWICLPQHHKPDDDFLHSGEALELG
jgi:hypothetical protein